MKRMKRNGTPGETEEEGVHRGVGKRRGRNPPPHLKSRCRGRGKRGENQPPSQNVTFGRCTGNSRLVSQEEEGPREQGRIFFFALLHSNWHCRNTTRTHDYGDGSKNADAVASTPLDPNIEIIKERRENK